MNTSGYRVAVLGYGEMGHAMEVLLQPGHTVDIWEKYPQPGFQSAVLEECVPTADFVLFCLPVNPHREIVTAIRPLLSDSSICISIAKGLDESGHTAARIFRDVLTDRYHYALVYGPMISEEIRAGRFAFGQVGCSSGEVYQRVHDLYRGTRLQLQHTADIEGISWSVILKNVYAILFGISDELGLGDNTRGFLAVEAVTELDAIVLEMGGSAGSPYNLAGLGDLVTTATSEGSHHHALGQRLARGEVSDIGGEGVHTLEMVSKHSLFDINQYPLFRLASDIVTQPENIEAKMLAYIKSRD